MPSSAGAAVRRRLPTAAAAAKSSAIHVRDSKAPDGPVLTLSDDAWSAFLRGYGTDTCV
ncbi:DUF397 domain-containing protein [Streptomyces sp. TRM68416]|uniref:DUF397 domain-containing protein n=1 Tax=Streptomyces sp. TRM68416 TaxID=2758412 RepID=UPI001CB71CF7|nr:DUF397 domain-containing protein [Streptomyces sp. TRM68416]